MRQSQDFWSWDCHHYSFFKAAQMFLVRSQDWDQDLRQSWGCGGEAIGSCCSLLEGWQVFQNLQSEASIRKVRRDLTITSPSVSEFFASFYLFSHVELKRGEINEEGCRIERYLFLSYLPWSNTNCPQQERAALSLISVLGETTDYSCTPISKCYQT